MSPVLYLARRIGSRPVAPQTDGILIRTWTGNSDIEPWLELHRVAFPAPRPEKRQWEAADLRRELLSRPTWRPEWMWFVEAKETPLPIGMISLLALPNDPPERLHIFWLAVDPKWRRRGIARELLVTAEQAAWDAGYRELALETLAAWQDAVGFYEACGYAPK